MRRKEDLLPVFPQLALDSFEITSPQEPRYNCIAWAADDTERWWWPMTGFWWPEEVERNCDVNHFVEAFETKGYVLSAGADLTRVPKTEKVAIYVGATGVPTHAARQLADGRWASKLGRDVDIEHVDVDDVGGFAPNAYGVVAAVLQRPRPDWD